MKSKKVVFVFVLVMFAFGALTAAEDYMIIVNKSNTVSGISVRDLGKIFLGKKTSWSDGTRIKLAVHKDGSVHRQFLKEIVKMSPMKFSLSWKKLVFTGKAGQLKVFKTEAEVKEFVKSNPSALAYISPASADDTIRVLPITNSN